MLHYLGGQFVGMCIGFVVGAFTPGIGRIIKGWFSSEVKAVKSKLP